MKYPVMFSLLLAAHQLVFAAAPVAVSPARVNILKWPGMNPNQFGCYVEKTFGVKDKRFNCSRAKPYVAHYDACEDKSYSEGPQFPDAAASKIHPNIKSINLTWEHGHLQGMGIVFDRKLSRAEMIRIVGLPAKFEQPYSVKKVMSIGIQDCSKDVNCLVMQMFDHMGAADVDCDGGD